jgi:uncharacterized protein (DUF2336 family)
MGSSQQRAIQNYRSRLSAKGLARFEVLGREADRELIRSLARSLALDNAETSTLRAIVDNALNEKPAQPGGILAALRGSPLVGADISLARSRAKGRKIDL